MGFRLLCSCNNCSFVCTRELINIAEFSGFLGAEWSQKGDHVQFSLLGSRLIFNCLSLRTIGNFIAEVPLCLFLKTTCYLSHVLNPKRIPTFVALSSCQLFCTTISTLWALGFPTGKSKALDFSLTKFVTQFLSLWQTLAI